MQTAKDLDYRTAVAKNLIKHKSDINGISATLNDQADVNGQSGVLETQDNHTTELASHTSTLGSHTTELATHNGHLTNILGLVNYGPCACYNGSKHYLFAVGTNYILYRRVYSGGWSGWIETVHVGNTKEYWISPPTCYAQGADVHIYVFGYVNTVTPAVVWHGIFDDSAGTLGQWENMGGNPAPIL
jgi:hypothetical protein